MFFIGTRASAPLKCRSWLDVFTRNEYKDLIVEILEFCQAKKGMEIHAWCIMTSHVHLVFRSIAGQNPELLLGDFKRFTSRSIIKAIQDNPKDPSLKVRTGEAKSKRVFVRLF